jgi:hypothetical protein
MPRKSSGTRSKRTREVETTQDQMMVAIASLLEGKEVDLLAEVQEEVRRLGGIVRELRQNVNDVEPATSFDIHWP